MVIRAVRTTLAVAELGASVPTTPEAKTMEHLDKPHPLPRVPWVWQWGPGWTLPAAPASQRCPRICSPITRFRGHWRRWRKLGVHQLISEAPGPNSGVLPARAPCSLSPVMQSSRGSPPGWGFLYRCSLGPQQDLVEQRGRAEICQAQVQGARHVPGAGGTGWKARPPLLLGTRAPAPNPTCASPGQLHVGPRDED